MTPDEFEFWQKAYLAALAGTANNPECYNAIDCARISECIATLSLEHYRTAKATVVQTTYATAD